MLFMRSFFSSSVVVFSNLPKSIHSVRSKGQLISESLILASPVSIAFERVSRVFRGRVSHHFDPVPFVQNFGELRNRPSAKRSNSKQTVTVMHPSGEFENFFRGFGHHFHGCVVVQIINSSSQINPKSRDYLNFHIFIFFDFSNIC